MANSMRIGGGGGSGLTLTVYVTSGAVVTAESGVYTASGTSVDGSATLAIPAAGTYTVTAVRDGISSNVGTVDVPAKIDITFKPVAKLTATPGLTYLTGITHLTPNDLHQCGEAISNNVEIIGTTTAVYIDYGVKSCLVTVGDTATMPLNSDAAQTIRLLGFNTIDLAQPSEYSAETVTGKVGMSFETAEIITTAKMKGSSDSTVGWGESNMRTVTMPECLAMIPTLWKNAMKTCSCVNTFGISPTADKLALHRREDLLDNGYQWYRAGGSKVKKRNGTAAVWWTRSPYGSKFYFVDESGSLSTSTNTATPSDYEGVVLAFGF